MSQVTHFGNKIWIGNALHWDTLETGEDFFEHTFEVGGQGCRLSKVATKVYISLFRFL